MRIDISAGGPHFRVISSEVIGFIKHSNSQKLPTNQLASNNPRFHLFDQSTLFKHSNSQKLPTNKNASNIPIPRNFRPINSLQTFHVSTFSTNQISRKFDPFPRFPPFHFSSHNHPTHSQTTLSPLFSRADFISTIRFTPSPLLTPHFTTHSLHSSTTHPHHYHLTSTTTTIITTSLDTIFFNQVSNKHSLLVIILPNQSSHSLVSKQTLHTHSNF